jgi:predicted ATPase
MRSHSLGRNSVMRRGTGSSSKPRKNEKITRILLTGGPCAGKTTILAKLQKTLDDLNYRVFCVPEAATMIMKGGGTLNMVGKSWDYQVQMQT